MSACAGRPAPINMTCRTVSFVRTAALIIVTITSVLAACTSPEDEARYVKEPFTAAQQQDIPSLNAAFQEAKTRLQSVENDTLRQELGRDLEQEYQRRLAEINNTEEQRRLEVAEQAAKERAAELARQALAEAENQKQLAAQQETILRAEEQERQIKTRQCIGDLEANMRMSDWIEGTEVLVLNNACALPVQFDLKCFTCGDAGYKTIFVDIPARGEKEIGFVEGWTGNFRGGERCEARLAGEVLRNIRIPAPRGRSFPDGCTG